MRQTSLSSIDQDTPDFNHLTEKREFIVTNKRNIPFTGEVYGKIISLSDIIFSPIPQLKCICCGFYGRTFFFCHPNLPPYYSWREKLSKYNFFMLIIGKIDVRERYKDDLKNFNVGEWKAGFYAGNEGTNILKKRVKQRRIETINYLSGFTKIRFCDEGGGCEKAVLPDTNISLINKDENAKDIIFGDIILGYDIVDATFMGAKMYLAVPKPLKVIRIVSQKGFDDSARQRAFEIESQEGIKVELLTPKDMLEIE